MSTIGSVGSRRRSVFFASQLVMIAPLVASIRYLELLRAPPKLGLCDLVDDAPHVARAERCLQLLVLQEGDHLVDLLL